MQRSKSLEHVLLKFWQPTWKENSFLYGQKSGNKHKIRDQKRAGHMQTQFFLCIIIPVESQITHVSFSHY